MKLQSWSMAVLACGLAWGCSQQPPTNGAKPLMTQPERSSPNQAPDPMFPESSIAPPESGPKCGAKTCAKGTECIEYYGIGGKAGGAMYSCEIRCKSDLQCPATTPKCATIADGPGHVCR